MLEKRVNTSGLARTLKISPASVSEMLSKLSGLKLIKNTPYHGFVLTQKGEDMAVKLIRKHRLIEVFLQQHLGYGWDEVHAEADTLEHVCSDKFIDKLDKYLKYPKLDPHGDPIPDIRGKFTDKKSISLADAEPGRSYIVSKVIDSSGEVLKYISGIGIGINTKIDYDEKLVLDNSILIKVNNKKHLLSKPISEHIYVTV
jgi:DtxR family Mn-dependent transcriptional regulator